MSESVQEQSAWRTWGYGSGVAVLGWVGVMVGTG